MGCLWAAHLCETQPVAFVDTRARSTAQRHFTFQPFNSEQSPMRKTFTLPSHPATQLPSEVEVLLVCTKSYDALPALSAVLATAYEPQAIVLLQNGMGSQQAILKAYPQARLYAAMTTEGAHLRRPGELVHAGKGLTRLGPISASAQRETPIVNLIHSLDHAGFATEWVPDIWPSLWQKLVINCAINPFTALERCVNGEVPKTALFQGLWPALRRELTQLLESAQCPLSSDALERLVFDVIHNTASNRSSMLQDIDAGRRTEIDDINGYAVQFLKAHHRAHAANLTLWEQVRALGH